MSEPLHFFQLSLGRLWAHMPSASLEVLKAWKEANYSLEPHAYLQPILYASGWLEVADSWRDFFIPFGWKDTSEPALPL